MPVREPSRHGSDNQPLRAHPDQLQLLRDDPALYPGAVEELLRYDSPFQSAPRTVTDDVLVRDRPLARGDLVYAVLGAANRDPLQFADPARLDIRRREGKQLAFGYGVHHCLGAALARLEAPIALRALFDRLPPMRALPDDPPRWKRSMVQRGLERFVVTW